MSSSSLNSASRAAAIERMATGELDVLVVGGGVVGAGTAHDAQTRGLRTALVEGQDWASGTSSRSSKLIHGGLRYLEMMDFGLVREALHERGLLLETIAPHLVRPVAFLYPLTHRGWERLYAGTGIALYDVMAAGARRGQRLTRHRHLSRRGALAKAPSLRADALIGAIQYYDAQVDDARHTMTLVRTAASFGALVANRTRVVGLETSQGRVVGARLLDEESQQTFVVHARQVISATGVWTDEFRSLALDAPANVRASKGVHFLVARSRLDLDTGLILRTEKSVLFVIPWGAHWIIGTTDTDWAGDKAQPVATDADIDYLLEHVNAVLVKPLTRADIQGVYAGLRPLLTGNSDSTTKLSREHVVVRPAPGLVVVVGGKYTTYRVMAKDAVDEAMKDLAGPSASSRTADIALCGAQQWPTTWGSRSELAKTANLDLAWTEHLLHRYGSLTSDLVELIRDDPSLAEPIGPGGEYLACEVVYAVTHEGALHLDDVLARRTHIEIETSDHGRSLAPAVARLMAPLLGWGEDTVASEIDRYAALLDASWSGVHDREP